MIVSLYLTDPVVLATLGGPGWITAVAGLGYVALGGLAASVGAAVTARAVRNAPGPVPPRVLKRQNLFGLFLNVYLVGGLAAALTLGYGRWVGFTLGLARAPLVGMLAAIAPFVAALLLVWMCGYPAYRAVRRRMAAAAVEPPVIWTRAQYVAYNARHHLLFVLVPVSLIVLLQDLLGLYLGPVLPQTALGAALLTATMIAAALSVFVVAPAMIVRIWRTRPLPDGPLRRGLERMAERMGLRFREILVWRTEGAIANAAVMGLVPRVRYVLLSDALLDRMDDAEVRAIFGHEAGHAASHHILHAMVFVISAVTLCMLAGMLLADLLSWGEWAYAVLPVVLVVAVAGVGFGMLSRRFERQSDVIGAWAVGADIEPEPPSVCGDADAVRPEGAALFARALQRIAALNGIPPRQRNWRHGSIADRISYILWLGATRGSRGTIDAAVRRIKRGLWVLLAVAVAAAVWAEFAWPVGP